MASPRPRQWEHSPSAHAQTNEPSVRSQVPAAAGQTSQLALAPVDHSTRDTDVHGQAALHAHGTSRPCHAAAGGAPARASQTCSTSAALSVRPARAAAPGRAYEPYDTRSSAFPPRRTRSVLPPASPGSLFHQAPTGAPRRSLATTHSPATRPAQTGRRPHVPAGTGRARVCRCVLRCHWDQNGRCSPGPPGAARFPPITACYAPPSTFTHARTRRSQCLFLLLPRPEEEVLENQNSVEGEGAEEEGTAVAGESPPPAAHTHQCLLCLANSWSPRPRLL